MQRDFEFSYIAHFIEAVVLVLMATGTVFVVSAGADIRASYDLHQFYNFTTLRNIIFFPLAVVVMYTVATVDYRRLSFTRGSIAFSPSTWLLCISVLLLVLTLVIGEGIGPEKRFARRWLHLTIGSLRLSLQPSELAKWSLLFFLAAFLDKYKLTIKLFRRRFLPTCAVIGLVVALIITQDFGTAVFVGLLSVIMLIMGRAHWLHILSPLPILIPAGILTAVTAPNWLLTTTRLNRIRSFLAMYFPESFSDISAVVQNYQAQQSLRAIGGGGLWGWGIGKGVFKYGHLPEDTSDFIFAVICEELGFVGGVVVMALFVLFVILGIVIVVRCRDHFGKLLAGGIVTAIGLQAAINIGVVTVVLPTKGIPLPFISAGGTSMLLTSAAVGVLLNIAHRLPCQCADLLPDPAEPKRYLQNTTGTVAPRGVRS